MIDHLSTNILQNIDNITTTLPGISDNAMVIFSLRTEGITDNPKYHLTQNWENAISMDFGLLARFNPFLQQIWSNRDVHETWKLLSGGVEDM